MGGVVETITKPFNKVLSGVFGDELGSALTTAALVAGSVWAGGALAGTIGGGMTTAGTAAAGAGATGASAAGATTAPVLQRQVQLVQRQLQVVLLQQVMRRLHQGLAWRQLVWLGCRHIKVLRLLMNKKLRLKRLVRERKKHRESKRLCVRKLCLLSSKV